MRKKKLDIFDKFLVSVTILIALIMGVTLYNYLNPKPIINSLIPVRPTYEYLKNISIFIFHDLGIGENGHHQGSIGSGTIVAEKEGFYYILTNKHVCEEDNVNCYIVLNGKVKEDKKIKLEFVKKAKEGIDLELWKVKSSLLIGKSVIKGFNKAKEQERVYSVGQYLGIPYIYTEGTKAGWEEEDELYNLPCAFGCSGSGIFNQRGELVAVVYAGNGLPTSFDLITSFDTSKVIAISSTNIEEFLKEIL